MTTSLNEKLHLGRFTEMSPLMATIVGYVLDESFTDPTIAELAASERENYVYIRPEGAIRFKGIPRALRP